jgi:hypothetical protein
VKLSGALSILSCLFESALLAKEWVTSSRYGKTYGNP